MQSTHSRPGPAVIPFIPTLVVLLLLPLLAACGGETAPATPTTGSAGGMAQDKASLVAALQQSGLTVSEEGAVNQPFFSLNGVSLRAGSEFIQVFEYADESAAQSDASKIAPDASIEGYRIDWLGPPHFYRVGRMIVIYPGTDQKTLDALESALGKPFAAAP